MCAGDARVDIRNLPLSFSTLIFLRKGLNLDPINLTRLAGPQTLSELPDCIFPALGLQVHGPRT